MAAVPMEHGVIAAENIRIAKDAKLRRSDLLLDVLRCIAATLVVLAHWRILFFQDFPTLIAPSAELKAFYFLTGIGRPSVMVFFVLSGYLVTGSALRANVKGTWSVGSYLNQRITRLGVVLLPALLLGWMWDGLGLRFFGHGFYDGFIHTVALRPDVAARHGLGILVQNAVFLQGITTTTYGTNDPLWSLSYEFWYYILLIPMLSLLAPRRFIRLGISVAAGGLILWFVGKAIALYFLIWLLGAAIALLVRAPRGVARGLGQVAIVLSGAAVAVSLLAMRAKVLPDGFRGDLILALSCAWFIWCVARDGATMRASWFTRGSATYAGWSYTLYLMHMPLLVFIASLLIRGSQWSPNLSHEVTAFGILAGVLLYAYLLSLVTERQTNSVRHWVTAQFMRSKPAPELVPLSK